MSEERDDGMVVCGGGAKNAGTGSAMTHATFVAPNATPPRWTQEKRLILPWCCIAPMDTPGVKLTGRASYEQMHTAVRLSALQPLR